MMSSPVPREIKKISTVVTGTEVIVTVLCNDNTVWVTREQSWRQLRSIPTTNEDKIK